jgi:hypothetical protein
MKKIGIIILLIIFNNYNLRAEEGSQLFNSTLNLLMKNSDFKIQNPRAGEVITENLQKILFKTEDSIISVNKKLDILFLTFIHFHYSFNDLQGILLNDKNYAYSFDLNINRRLIIVLPFIYTRKNNKDVISELNNLERMTKSNVESYRKLINQEYFLFYQVLYERILKKCIKNYELFFLRKVVSEYLLSYLNTKYKGFEIYPIQLSPLILNNYS